MSMGKVKQVSVKSIDGFLLAMREFRPSRTKQGQPAITVRLIVPCGRTFVFTGTYSSAKQLPSAVVYCQAAIAPDAEMLDGEKESFLQAVRRAIAACKQTPLHTLQHAFYTTTVWIGADGKQAESGLIRWTVTLP